MIHIRDLTQTLDMKNVFFPEFFMICIALSNSTVKSLVFKTSRRNMLTETGDDVNDVKIILKEI